MTRSLRFVRVSAEDSCSQIRNGKLQMQSVQQPKPISLSRGGDPESADCTTRLSRAPIWPTGARSFCHHLVQGSRSIYHPNGSPLFISGSCNRIKSRGGSPSVIADGFEKVAPPSTAFYRTKDWGGGVSGWLLGFHPLSSLYRLQATDDRPTDGNNLVLCVPRRRLQLLMSPSSHPRTSIQLEKKEPGEDSRREGGKLQSR